jgi:hypothetical protein
VTNGAALGGTGLAPQSGEALEALALSLWDRGRRDEAIAVLERQIAASKNAGQEKVQAAPVSGESAAADPLLAAPLPQVSYLPAMGSPDAAQSGEQSLLSAAPADELPPAVPAHTPVDPETCPR